MLAPGRRASSCSARSRARATGSAPALARRGDGQVITLTPLLHADDGGDRRPARPGRGRRRGERGLGPAGPARGRPAARRRHAAPARAAAAGRRQRAGAAPGQPAAGAAGAQGGHRPGDHPPAHHAVRGAVLTRSSRSRWCWPSSPSPAGCCSGRGWPPRPRRPSSSPACSWWSSWSRSCRPASTSSATPPPRSAGERPRARWASASTCSGRRSTPTSPTATASAAAAGCAPTSAACTSTRIVVLLAFGVWWLTGWHALLLIVATQVLQMIRQLAPMLRFDGYHVLADVTGVPDLYQRIGPILKGLLPGRWRQPEAAALKTWARVVVTLWVLAVVPLMLFSMLLMVLSLPRLLATAWVSVGAQSAVLSRNFADGDFLGVLARALASSSSSSRCSASRYVLVRLVRRIVDRHAAAHRGQAGPPRRWPPCSPRRWSPGWPGRGGRTGDRYRPVHAYEGGTVSTPSPRPLEQLGARRRAAASGDDDLAGRRRTAAHRRPPRAGHGHDAPRAGAGERDGAHLGLPVRPAAAPGNRGQPGARGQHDRRVGDSTTSRSASSGPTATTALNKNEAYAFASCTDCRTVAVAFQVVLVAGQVDVVVPQNLSGALNYACVRCVTQALATQLVVSVPGAAHRRPERAARGGLEGAAGLRCAHPGRAAGRAAVPAERRSSSRSSRSSHRMRAARARRRRAARAPSGASTSAAGPRPRRLRQRTAPTVDDGGRRAPHGDGTAGGTSDAAGHLGPGDVGPGRPRRRPAGRHDRGSDPHRLRPLPSGAGPAAATMGRDPSSRPGGPVSESPAAGALQNHDLLGIYCNDHLAASTGGIELVSRMLGRHSGTPYEEHLRRAARRAAGGAGRAPRDDGGPRASPCASTSCWRPGWGRSCPAAKLNGHLLSRSPSSDLIEFEFIATAVLGKRAGFETLRALAEVDRRIDAAAARPADRAGRQAARVAVRGAPRGGRAGVRRRPVEGQRGRRRLIRARTPPRAPGRRRRTR